MTLYGHAARIRTEQVAHVGARYWGTCSCGWTSPARFSEQEMAQQSANNHASAMRPL